MKNEKYFPLLTYALIFLNISIFIIQSWKSIDINEPISALNWGVNFAPYTLDNQYWRLLSSTFIHYNIFHLAFNLFALYSIGKNVENQIGNFLFIIIYLTCGALASTASIYYNLFTFSMGASGAIFGLFGFELILSLKSNWQDKRLIKSSIISFVIYLVIITLIGSKLYFDNAAHIGGAITGIILGAIFILIDQFQISKITSIPIIALILSLGVILTIPDYQARYFKTFQYFIKIDDLTVDTYNTNFSNDIEFANKLYAVDRKWDSVAIQIDSVNNVPPTIEEDIDLIKNLSELRKREIRYFITGIEKESYIYQDSIGIVRQILRNGRPFNYPLRLEKVKRNEIDTSQNIKEPITVYYDESWKPCSIVEAEFYRVGMQDSIGRWDGWVRDYYISGEIQMKGSYKKDSREGVFLFYSKENTYEAAGRMKDNYHIGKWEYFHPNGKMSREMRFKEKAYLINAWDEFGIKRVNEGNGYIQEWHDNGITKLFEKYEDGLKDSISYGNHNTGQLHFKEYYNKGTLEIGRSYSKDGSSFSYDFSTYIPHPLKGDKYFNDYINDFLKEKKIQGYGYTLELLFNVDKNYRPFNIRVLKTDDADLINICKKLLSNGPEWVPAKERGQEIIYPDRRIRINIP